MDTPPPPPPLGPPPGYRPPDPPAAPQRSTAATAALVLGLVGLAVCPFILSIVSILLGVRAREAIDGSAGRITGRGMATASVVLGAAGLIGWTVAAIVWAAVT